MWLLKYLDNNFMSVMPHEPELRQVKDINYKIVECNRGGVAKFIANSLYNVFIYETYHE